MLYYLDFASLRAWLALRLWYIFSHALAYYCTERLLLRLWAAGAASAKSMPEETLAEPSPGFPL